MLRLLEAETRYGADIPGGPTPYVEHWRRRRQRRAFGGVGFRYSNGGGQAEAHHLMDVMVICLVLNALRSPLCSFGYT